MHRPARADWSLPKGKLDPGEHVVTAALRECDEETGFTPVLQAPLPTQSYSVLSRPKVVNYWRARIRADEGFTPDEEIDEIRWVARRRRRRGPDVPVRRATGPAGRRHPGHDPAGDPAPHAGDEEVALRRQGRRRAPAHRQGPVAEQGARPPPRRLRRDARCTPAAPVGAPRPSSASPGTSTTPSSTEPLLTEEGHHDDPRGAAARAIELALTPEPLVLCSHRPVLPTILDSMAVALGVGLDDPRWSRAWHPKLPPGGFIVVHRAVQPGRTGACRRSRAAHALRLVSMVN